MDVLNLYFVMLRQKDFLLSTNKETLLTSLLTFFPNEHANAY